MPRTRAQNVGGDDIEMDITDETETNSSATINEVNESSQFDMLYRKCRSLHADLQIFENLSDPEDLPTQIKADLDEIEKIKKEYSETSITALGLAEQLKPEKVGSLESERVAFMTSAKSIRNKLLSILPQSTNAKTSSAQPMVQAKLPRLEIPVFSGAFDQWSEFKGAFTSLISNRQNLEKHSKYQFLRLYLSGPALDLIKRLPRTEDYYDTAWNILNKYYDSPFNEMNTYLNELHTAKNIASLVGPNKTKALRDLIIKFRQYVTGLETLFEHHKIDACSQIMIYWFLLKCDKRLNIEWNREIRKSETSLPKFGEFLEFVDAFCTAEEQATSIMASTSTPSSLVNKPTPKFKGRRPATVAVASEPEKKREKSCQFCFSSNHYLSSCEKFRELPASSRVEYANEKKLCKFCLRVKCYPKFCYRRPCKICNQGHNTLLHIKEGKKNLLSKFTIPTAASAIYCQLSQEAILATAIVTAFGKIESSKFDSRILLDQGSQINIISKSFVNKLGLQMYLESQSVVGIGNKSSDLNYRVDLFISSKYSNLTFSISCYVMNEIVSLVPSSYFSINNWKIPNQIPLADPYFNIPANIDLLVGSPIFWKVLKTNQIRLGKNLPKLWETDFGWIVADDLTLSKSESNISLISVSQSKSNLKNLIERFWIIEEKSPQDIPSENFDHESFFLSTVSKAADGRFIVSLPFKDSLSKLGNSKVRALKRFRQLEESLSHNPERKLKYANIIREYISLGHLRKVDSDRIDYEPSYYVPHHVILKDTTTSTPERIVFDFSMKTTSGESLNDLLSKGSVVQPELISTIICFRARKWVFVADIIKMYRQIWVDRQQTSFQRILWRESVAEPIEVYELQTVTFGMTSSPYLATRTLQKIADDLDENLPDVKFAIANNFYVDDLLSGNDNLESAKQLRDNLIETLRASGFELTKWCSNSKELIDDLPENMRGSQFPLALGEKHTVKTLGLLWMPSDDIFKVWLHQGNLATIKTKRQVLSAIAALYDPLGMVAPVICKAKIIMQVIWKCKSNIDSKKSLGWDENLPEHIISSWLNFASKLHHLNSISIPRHLFSGLPDKPDFIEFHGFCDASESAYGAVIYVRSGYEGIISVNLLCAKSRVAPLKLQTIPRLELCGALLLSELLNNVLNYLNNSFVINLVRLWTDSTITLSWLRKSASCWQSFVANRVQKIQNLTSDYLWDHINGNENPADILSRGSDADKLVNHEQWFAPPFLLSTITPWNNEIAFDSPNMILPERKNLKRTVASTTLKSCQDFKIFSQFSSYMTLLRTTALILRFSHNLKYPHDRKKGYLSSREINDALNRLVWLAQRQSFAEEVDLLTQKRELPKSSKLLSLSPFIDKNGIIRVGGRLDQSDLSYDRRHPMLLSHKHPFSYLIVQYEHLRHLHGGQRLIKSVIRQRFWILRVDNLARQCIRKCIKCLRFRADSHTQFMASLPRSRVTPHRPFSIVGVDYAGPFSYVEIRGRGRKQILKAYISLFVCFATKAIHLELVSDLSTPTFLAALDRFISRRGIPTEIYSDNGTNFVGAARELELLKNFLLDNREKIYKYATNKCIKWSFTPPYSPSFGGLWEAGVKSVKSHLKISIGNSIFSFEQFSTLCSIIEACLNSRPLYSESVDANDPEALTPGHFLVGQALTTLPKPDLTAVPQNRLKYWEEVQQVAQRFWKRWSLEYLNTLQQRNKWRIEKEDLKLGEVVLIKSTPLPPSQWQLGKIIETHSGADGHVRVVTLQTTNSIVKRSISKIIPLPIV